MIKSENKGYGSFTRYSNKLLANENRPQTNKIDPGVYTIHYNSQQNLFWFEDASVLSDEILDLPSGEFDRVVDEMNLFLKPETKTAFKEYGYIYKRSVLMHGLPGTGKTVITQRLVRDVVAKNGIVLYVNNPNLLGIAYAVLNDLAPDMFTMVVFEEFDRMVSGHEETLLSLLDGEVQKENVMYVATTNYINEIPARIRRPGRFSSVIEVGYPTAEARRFYLNAKLKDKSLIEHLTEKTDGLSIDELKEVIQAHIILKQELDSVLTRIKDNKKAGEPTKKKKPTSPQEAIRRLMFNIADDHIDEELTP